MSTSEAPAMTQAAIRKLVADSLQRVHELPTYQLQRNWQTLCPIMVPDSKKIMEVFIGGLPRSIERNVTASTRSSILRKFFFPPIGIEEAYKIT
ncbi:hypothetical protein Tco_0514866 [Tanacetum coccineum]